LDTASKSVVTDQSNNMIPLKLWIVVAFAVVPGCLGVAQAQQNSVAVTPMSIDVRVKRGTSYTQTFTVTNNTETRLRFQCSLGDIWYNEQNERISGAPGTLPRSASQWVQFLPSEVIVEPRSSGTVKAIITVPQTAGGGYYSVPIFEAAPADRSTPMSSVYQASTATASIAVRFRGLIMLTTLDAAEYNVEILEGRISPPGASAELVAELYLHNRSTAHVRVRGAFAILNSSGVLMGRGTIRQKRYLPGQRNVLRSEWAGKLAAGQYTSVITLSYDRAGSEPATLVYELPFVVR
jgi:hypothetical protein